jgi:hypothetical protein
MKNRKRVLRRYKSKCKLEKRIKIWVQQGSCFVTDDGEFRNIGGHQIEIIKDLIRKEGYWSFLKWTSTPCSCSLCKGERYKRLSKSELNKLINEQLDEA